MFQINPVWLFGPYKAAVVSVASQPDWYGLFLEGSTRLFPAWEARFSLFGQDYTLSPLFWPAVVLPGVMTTLLALYPFLEARVTRDQRIHNLLQRPRDVPVRTGLGAAGLAFYAILTFSGANDVIAEAFHISLNAMTWGGLIGLIIVPPIAYYVAYRICLGLQQHDREVLAHGVETGIIRRLPDGRFIEVHQPLGKDLQYTGAPVPKKMNRLGALPPAVRGFFVPIEQPVPPPAPQPPALEERREEEETGAEAGHR